MKPQSTVALTPRFCRPELFGACHVSEGQTLYAA